MPKQVHPPCRRLFGAIDAEFGKSWTVIGPVRKRIDTNLPRRVDFSKRSDNKLGIETVPYL
jgi:hypothetical protein